MPPNIARSDWSIRPIPGGSAGARIRPRQQWVRAATDQRPLSAPMRGNRARFPLILGVQLDPDLALLPFAKQLYEPNCCRPRHPVELDLPGRADDSSHVPIAGIQVVV